MCMFGEGTTILCLYCISNARCQLGVPTSVQRNYAIYPTLVEALYGHHIVGIACCDQSTIAFTGKILLNYLYFLDKSHTQSLERAINSTHLFANMKIAHADNAAILVHSALFQIRMPVLHVMLTQPSSLFTCFLNFVHDNTTSDPIASPLLTIPNSIYYNVLHALVRYIYVDNVSLEMNEAEWNQLYKLSIVLHVMECEWKSTTGMSYEQFATSKDYQFANLFPLAQFSSIHLLLQASLPNPYYSTATSIARLLYLCAHHLHASQSLVPKELQQPLMYHVYMQQLYSHAQTANDKDLFMIEWTKQDKIVHVIKMHKFVAASMSAYFAAMLASSMEEASASKITIPCTDNLDAQLNDEDSIMQHYEYVQTIVQFMYTLDGKLIDESNACACFLLANYYAMKELKRTCEELIALNIDFDNIWSLLYMAEMHDAIFLKEKCYQYVVNEFANLHKLQAYKQLDKKLQSQLHSRALRAGTDKQKKEQAVATITPTTITYTSKKPKKLSFFESLFGSKVARDEDD